MSAVSGMPLHSSQSHSSLFWHAKEFTGLMPALGNLKESRLVLS